eukprot:CAMPEP_0113241424 /NCGR_PEP_ID=MMETSP0008_2-20120614/6792_1 /TAXON_ID=97485 /ORGANISM="Prymnesium parvum" /LENGTH=52 /DNA_ID=CAMNT_0000088837 /DNA_START=49 /DNA_END=205 /DNA_ORIENTATION=+ /assembly_acc=CAM_ASM_000153
MAGEGTSRDEKMNLSPSGAADAADDKWRRATTGIDARSSGVGDTEDDKHVLE